MSCVNYRLTSIENLAEEATELAENALQKQEKALGVKKAKGQENTTGNHPEKMIAAIAWRLCQGISESLN